MNARVFILCVGVSVMTLFWHDIVQSNNQPNTVTVSIKNKKGMEEVAFIGYTYKCSSCGYEKGEGFKSFTDDYAYEECKACNDYRKIGGNDNDK